ncbi:MAG: signal peptidase II [Lachnospiraceae bacterium]|nr:signal peptidase II [Lachnospiraceae bacterium]
MKADFSRIIKACVLFPVLIAFDLFTKSIAVNALDGGKRIPLIPGVLEFYYIQNRGAAFGIFQDGTFILGLISAIALAVLIFVYLRVPDGKKYLPLRLVLIFIAAGAAGNLYDRITLQYVRDFIYFSLIDFPVFNVADIYVTCSVFILAYLILFYYKEEDLQFGNRRS